MDKVIEVGKWIIENSATICAGIVSVCGGLIMIFLPIPGEQPEKTLHAIADFFGKFSKK